MWTRLVNLFQAQATPPTAAQIRQKLARARQRHDQLRAEADALALDAMHVVASSDKYARTDGEAADVARQMALLTAALPIAEAREAAAQQRADAAALAQRVAEYDRATAEARAFLDGVLARLVEGDELTIARDFTETLRSDAVWLGHTRPDPKFRRPLDPLHEIRQALQLRVERIDRARWHSGPITVGPSHAAKAEAIARVVAKVGTKAEAS